MAYQKRTWFARIGSGLNKFIIGDKDGNNKQTLTNSPDSVTQQGDVISADNLNDLENRIEAGFTADATAIGTKADKTYVDNQLATKQNTLTFDNVPTSGSNNPVKSGGVFSALAGKQDTLTFDNIPTSGSNNPVKSGGVYSALLGKVSPSDLVIGTVRWQGQWSNPYSNGTRKSFNFDVTKSGYTPIGIVGYDVDLYKSDGYVKFSVTMVDLNASQQVANLFIIFLEDVSVAGASSSVSIDVLYVKNS